MHWIETSEDVELVARRPNFPPGRYLVDDVNAGEYLSMWSHAVRAWHTPNQKPFDPTKDWNGKTIGLIRAGGYGDLLFLTPLCREIKLRWPAAKIAVLTVPFFAEILQHNPDVDETPGYPVSVEDFERMDAIAEFGDILERSKSGRTKHAVDCFAEVMCLELTDKTAKMILTEEELAKAIERFPRTSRKRYAVQLRASALGRTYHRMPDVIMALAKNGHEVFVFNTPGMEKVETNFEDQVIDVAHLQPPPTFRESCAIMMMCDGLVAPDSSLTHVAGVFGLPAVALYGPFPWQLRTAYSPTTVAINGNARCAPCFHHIRGGNQFPKHGPCFVSGKCEALGEIDPGRIVTRLERISL
jgi:ADP-heptose:LPS heptosyltransferase